MFLYMHRLVNLTQIYVMTSPPTSCIWILGLDDAAAQILSMKVKQKATFTLLGKSEFQSTNSQVKG